MSLVNQMLQELDKRGQGNPVLAAAVPYGVTAGAPDPAQPVASRSRRAVFAVSALAAAIAAAWYWPSQEAAQSDTPARQQQLASSQAPQPATAAVASSTLRAPVASPVAAPVTPPARLADATDRGAASKAAESPTRNGRDSQKASARAESPKPAKAQPARKTPNAPAERARSPRADETRKTSRAAVPAPPRAATKDVTAAAAPGPTLLAQPALAPAQPNAQPAPISSPPALTAPVVADTANAGEAQASVPAGLAKAALPTALPERAAPPNNNAGSGGVHRQTRQSTPLDSADAAYREGLARFNAGDSAQAMRSFRAALAENPKHRRATEALAAVQVERREWDAALATLRDALAIDPKQPSLAMLAARLLARDGNREAAVQTLKAAVDDTSPADGHAALAALLGELKRDREAIPYWLAALKKLPDRAAWWLGLAVALETDRRPADARAAYERAVALGGLRSDSADFARTRIYALR